ncbi:MAG: tannase/feruloyl esterase family alpha/beta hydrolase [Burkholderiaceae bacterium]|nr:tannase/feruloyl esterase family alpha/beta hydrolase [Burkholderiaceae bacterium]
MLSAPLPPSIRRNALPPLAALLLLAACGTAPPSGEGQPAVACGRMPSALRDLDGLRMVDAETVAADGQGHPAHCRISGRLHERRGDDGQRYAIGFELRLPVGWSGRLLHQPQAGRVDPAYGGLAVLGAADALSRGIAVLSSDGGHDSSERGFQKDGAARGQAFGRDPQARADLGHAADATLWPLAQTITQRHYGQAPRWRYIAGCGEGGRRALVAASRTPEQYDGVLAGAPALHLPRAALQSAWEARVWRTVDPEPQRALSAEDLQRVAQAVLARCDAQDLLVDGLVADVARCQRSLRWTELVCGSPGASAATCLDRGRAAALKGVLDGAQDGQGRPLYAHWPLDPGIATPAWRQWKLDGGGADLDGEATGTVLAAASLSRVFSTPPVAVDGTPAALRDWLLQLDLDQAAEAMAATDERHPQSALALFDPPDVLAPRLDALARRGGRVLVYHGAADPVLSLQATLRWTEALQAQLGLAQADQRARSFAVPGMGHCSGGPATDRFDALGALMAWVEQGRAPDRLEAQVDAANPELPAGWSRQRGRALCPWPRVARYAGGPPEAAGSFRCAMP